MNPSVATLDLTGCFASDAASASAFSPLLAELPNSAFRGSGSALLNTITVDTPTTVINEEHLLPQVGEVVDKYRIEAELGRGGFAAVYRATHLLMRTTVALKILFPWTLRANPHLGEALCEEAQLISLIDHPNVVRVLDVTSGERFTYIIMEYIDGTSLHRALQRKPITIANVLKVGIHLCNGLQAAQAQGLIHRDIKPGNILVSRSGQAKLVDFGLARRAGIEPRLGSGPGPVTGTPAYIAPEQATAPEQADHRADIYSLGATLFHAATGVLPFPQDEPMQMILSHINSPPPDPLQINPALPPDLAALIMRMMAKKPDDRPAKYTDIGSQLMTIYNLLLNRPTTPLKSIPSSQAGSESSSVVTKTPLLGKLRGLFQ